MADYSYLIRRRVFVLAGAKFDLFDASGRQIGFSKQKAFKLKGEFALFREESSEEPFLRIKGRKILDFSAAYDVMDAAGHRIGTWKRKGVKSMVRDAWVVEDAVGNEVAILQEDSLLMALLRRFLCALFPQRFNLIAPDGRRFARYERSFIPFVSRQRTLIYKENTLPEMLILAGAMLLLAVEEFQLSL